LVCKAWGNCCAKSFVRARTKNDNSKTSTNWVQKLKFQENRLLQLINISIAQSNYTASIVVFRSWKQTRDKFKSITSNKLTWIDKLVHSTNLLDKSSHGQDWYWRTTVLRIPA
jgi:hypothetical protein